MSRYWQVLYLGRWAGTLLIMVYLRDYYSFQISLLLVASFGLQIAAVLGKPFSERVENVFVVFNELAVCTYLYILLGLSDNSDCDQYIRERMGWGLLGTVFLSALVNFVKTGILAIQAAIHQRRLKKA